jgi:hypothetical protein
MIYDINDLARRLREGDSFEAVLAGFTGPAIRQVLLASGCIKPNPAYREQKREEQDTPSPQWFVGEGEPLRSRVYDTAGRFTGIVAVWRAPKTLRKE